MRIEDPIAVQMARDQVESIYWDGYNVTVRFRDGSRFSLAHYAFRRVLDEALSQ